jgi:hypothetical protein
VQAAGHISQPSRLRAASRSTKDGLIPLTQALAVGAVGSKCCQFSVNRNLAPLEDALAPWDAERTSFRLQFAIPASCPEPQLG